MRTCLVSALYPIQSAIPEYTEGLIEGLASSLKSDQIYVIANRNSEADLTRSANVRICPTWQEGPQFIFQILQKAIRLRPRVAHIQHEFSLYGGPLSAILFPVLLVLLRVARIRTVVTFHGVLTTSIIDDNFRRDFYVSKRIPFLRVVIFAITLLSVHAANRIIVHSSWQRSLLERYYRASPSSAVVVRHGTRIFPQNSTRHDQSIVRGIFFGYITPNKGLDTLIEAFKKMETVNLELTIVGGRHRRDNSYYEKIRMACEHVDDPSRIRFLGYQPSKEVHNILRDADFAIFPYTSAISVSGALCVAIGHGLPIIASQTRAFLEYLFPGRNCVMIRPGDADALRESLELLVKNPDYRTKLGMEMREFSASISWEQIGRLTAEIYSGIAHHE